VPVTAFVTRLLETEIGDRDDGALVFESARGGGYLTLGQGRYGFTKAAVAVDGCEGVRLHDLRHTCASLAISADAKREGGSAESTAYWAQSQCRDWAQKQPLTRVAGTGFEPV
jgi:integrase